MEPDKDGATPSILSFFQQRGFFSNEHASVMMDHIGKYNIVAELGRGGMGMVYKGRDPIIGRDVAIKVIQERILQDPAIKERFYREARTAGHLSHENITIIYDVGEEQGMPFLVMEYLAGQDLQELLNSGRPIPLVQKLHIARQICSGLAYAHDHQIIHRDVKPANIRVLPDGRVKIMDFGIARLQSEVQGLTQTNTSLGTPRYMAPEQIIGEAVDHRSDIFSFGVVFYELLTGDPPFDGDHITAIIYKILNAEPPPLNLEPIRLREDLQPIVEKCLEKDLTARYQHLKEVLRDLNAVSMPLSDPTVALSAGEYAGLANEATIAVPAPSRTGAPARREALSAAPARPARLWLWAALGLLVLGGLAVGGYAVLMPSVEPTVSESATVPAEPPDLAQAPLDSVGTEAPAEHEAANQPEAAVLPAPDAGASALDTAARQAAERERTRMAQARERILARRSDTAVRSLFDRAEQARRSAERQYDDAHFAQAEQAFHSARTLFEEIQQTLAAEAQAAERSQPVAEQTPPPAEQEPVEKEPAEQQPAPQPETTTRPDTPEGPSLEEQATTVVNDLARRLTAGLEDRNLEKLRAVHSFYGSFKEFVESTNKISAQVTPGPVRVMGDRATVPVSFALNFEIGRQRQTPRFEHTWTLERSNDQWLLRDVAAR